jgi:hypothetical protein
VQLSNSPIHDADREILPLYKGNKIMTENKNEAMRKEEEEEEESFKNKCIFKKEEEYFLNVHCFQFNK